MDHIFGIPKERAQHPIIMGVFESQTIRKHPCFRLFDADEQSFLLRAVKKDAGRTDQHTWLLVPGQRLKPVCIIGLGKKEEWSARKLILESRRFVSYLKAAHYRTACLLIDDFRVRNLSFERTAEIIATNIEMARYEFNIYKEKPQEGWHDLDAIYYDVRDASERASCSRGLAAGAIIGGQTNAARTLANTPGGIMTPKLLAKETIAMGTRCGFSVRIFGEKEMKKLGMDAILAVSKGSREEAQFIVMEYQRGPKSHKPLVFVGKGITFDSGGLHLKPSNAMDDMHLDMSGGASVIGALGAIARMGLKTHVIGIVAAVENMPSGESYRPGDIITSMSGTTIEVVSTDAEGRVTLADALWYAKRFNPKLVVDIATLTGACIIALGHHASALFSQQDAVASALLKCGEESGDYLWRMPLWEEYDCGLKGTFGDVLNAPKNREAGAINGALFLKRFAKDFPAWAHIDIASTMLSVNDIHLAKGATGSATRLLVEIARSYNL